MLNLGLFRCIIIRVSQGRVEQKVLLLVGGQAASRRHLAAVDRRWRRSKPHLPVHAALRAHWGGASIHAYAAHAACICTLGRCIPASATIHDVYTCCMHHTHIHIHIRIHIRMCRCSLASTTPPRWRCSGRRESCSLASAHPRATPCAPPHVHLMCIPPCAPHVRITMLHATNVWHSDWVCTCMDMHVYGYACICVCMDVANRLAPLRKRR